MLRSVSTRSNLLKLRNIRLITTKTPILNNATIPTSSQIDFVPLPYIRTQSAETSKNNITSLNFDNPFNSSQTNAMVTMNEKRDIMSLWSLLEACIQSNFKDRAFSILKSLYSIKSNKPNFIDDYNYYFNSICHEFTDIKLMIAKLNDDLKNHFIDVDYNDKTLAILIHHSLRITKSDSPDLTDHILTFFRMSIKNVRNICSFVDILTLNDFERLHNDLQLVKGTELPNSMKQLILHNEELSESKKNNGTETDREHMSLNTQVKTLEKDVSKLLDVETIGMKVVKHTLLGLSLTKEQKEKISRLSSDSNILNFDESKTVDFFEFYNSLPTEEEQAKFESILNEFNQERQHALELRASDAAKERWKHDFEEAKARGDLSIKRSLNAKLWKWYNAMLPLLKKEINLCRAVSEKSAANKERLPKADSKRLEYAPYLALVNPEKMCVIAILEILKLNSTGGIIEGMRTARALISVGKAIEMEFRSEQLLKNESYIFKDVNKKSPEFKTYLRKAKKSFRSSKIEQAKIVWPQSIRAKVGSILVSILIHVAKVEIEGIDPITHQKIFGTAPAFSHSYQYHNGSKLGVIRIHKSLVQQLDGERLMASVQPQLLPMLVEPRPWVNWKSGGYYYTQSTLVRSKDSPEQIAYLEAASNVQALDKVYDGLNVLGDTAWTVNRRIFEIISKVWNKGGSFLEIPGIQQESEFLPPPPKNADPSVINEWKNKNKILANKYSSNRSMRCDLNYKLEIARAFLGERFYFPHNLDFRGRAYPLSPHFNHLGNDMSRGLLIFWKGKRLGKEGLSWLKVHLSNLYGVDKVPLLERENFIDDHLEEIKDSAENPLNGKYLWWQKADKPWQALATCIELNEALKLENPEDFISHQPVHQDGTCNGLQHYAALGGDIEGAQQVNLVPGEKPNDVYAHVAKIVQGKLRETLQKDPNDEMAKFLVDKLNRKVVKQTVMTHVYGVTLLGATLQIDKQLNDLFDDSSDSMKYSKYLARHVFAAIRESFEGAHLIQDWLGVCSKKLSKSIRLDVDEKSFKNGNKPEFMTSVIWTTPLGLPIVQPYRQLSKKQIETNLQSVFISDPFAVNQVNARRQKAGFPPNFIHSLDASHMLLSASECHKDGLVFASVHDSYWTHACDVSKMNKHLREQFVKLHEVDLIERLKEEFDERYKNYVEIIEINKSSNLAKRIVEVRSDLSKKLRRTVTLADEVYFEKQRQKLLNSNFEDDVNRGKKMITTVSLIEEEENSASLKVKPTDTKKLLILAPLKLPDIPPKGDFDVENVKQSTYFFS
ncbi:hypothetical protein KAFR_0C03560 [Kazachstania africana CBS 2517]|uniref:DNA-directed RNA polymerase n=1 Tax=Kazachstania africana (strain ATCC 22294 / BCRC 22015 / CBS 2517 / CECT 1963 / NBRC 1671 / NRRL Y-8276) TaxID=1071382 RepID=H2ASJ8_KAZAF|nr:hypothetical protein KAFR_0C03560 [Kazachstania africana CBS 2517]CCF57348.1 hypothetical protein KAFR_0C03560 [Kazachstania africana CBS 2517]